MTSTSGRPNGSPGWDVDPGEAPEHLTQVVARGVLWKAATRSVGSVTRLVVLIVLARVLTPEDYGLAGMAMVVTTFVLIFTDPALGAALVQRPTIDERDRSTVFWLATAIGVLLTILGVAISGLVADFFGEPEVERLFAVTSLCFVLASLSVTHRALLLRRLEYRTLEIREMVSLVVGGAVAIAVALAGYGPWAVVWNVVAFWTTSTVLLWVLLDWRPRRMFSAESVRNLGGFSARIFGSSLLTWGNANLDKGLVGRFLGPAALGAYSLAYTAMLVPMTVVGQPVYQTVGPAYARIHEQGRLERAWLAGKRVSAALVAPALLALIVVAPDFVPVVLGDKWDEAIVPLQLLCVGGIADSLAALNWSVLQARGHGSTLLRVTLLSSIVTWAAFAGGLQWGIVGVAALYAVARWLLVIPTTWMTTRALEFDLWAALRASSSLLPAALSAAAIGLGSRLALLETDVPEAARLVLVGAVIVVAYAAIVLLLAPSLLGEIKRAVRVPDEAQLHGRPV
jgi:O-antigen/teichoic acid export membrane protein